MSEIKIVSEQTDKAIAEKRAKDHALSCLQHLAANLMRVSRGAGKPWDLPKQSYAFAEASHDYAQIAGMGLSSYEITAALDVWREPVLTDYMPAYEAAEAKEHAVKASLQIAASRLIEDPLRERAGETDLRKAMDLYEHRGGRESRTKSRSGR